jgi:hypothetical protein
MVNNIAPLGESTHGIKIITINLVKFNRGVYIVEVSTDQIVATNDVVFIC